MVHEPRDDWDRLTRAGEARDDWDRLARVTWRGGALSACVTSIYLPIFVQTPIYLPAFCGCYPQLDLFTGLMRLLHRLAIEPRRGVEDLET